MRYDKPSLVRTGLAITHCSSSPKLFFVSARTNKRHHHHPLVLFVIGAISRCDSAQLLPLLAHGDPIKAESATLPKGTYIAYMKLLRPKTKAFIDIVHCEPAGCS
jgi:hypothetical protein